MAHYRSYSPVIGYSGHIPGEKWRVGSRSRDRHSAANSDGVTDGLDKRRANDGISSATTASGTQTSITTDGSHSYDWEGNPVRKNRSSSRNRHRNRVTYDDDKDTNFEPHYYREPAEIGSSGRRDLVISDHTGPGPQYQVDVLDSNLKHFELTERRVKRAVADERAEEEARRRRHERRHYYDEFPDGRNYRLSEPQAESRGPEGFREPRDPRGFRDIREPRELRAESSELKDIREFGLRESRRLRDLKGSRNPRELVEQKESAGTVVMTRVDREIQTEDDDLQFSAARSSAESLAFEPKANAKHYNNENYYHSDSPATNGTVAYSNSEEKDYTRQYSDDLSNASPVTFSDENDSPSRPESGSLACEEQDSRPGLGIPPRPKPRHKSLRTTAGPSTGTKPGGGAHVSGVSKYHTNCCANCTPPRDADANGADAPAKAVEEDSAWTEGQALHNLRAYREAIGEPEESEYDEWGVPTSGYAGHIPEMRRLGVGKSFGAAAQASADWRRTERRSRSRERSSSAAGT